jgi:DNA-directed RNA polymerase subunit RPC12/RpoP
MTFIQKMVTALLPAKWAEAIEADSRRWLLRCPNCDTVQSVWDIGGVRYKAVSKGKRVGVRCSSCGQRHMMKMDKVDE